MQSTDLPYLRLVFSEAKQHPIKRGDGLDFSHAVISSAFANVAMLDKHWKRRIGKLPQPNQLARIYYEPELDRMVDDIEAAMIERTQADSSRNF